jgi:hypothetical protein
MAKRRARLAAISKRDQEEMHFRDEPTDSGRGAAITLISMSVQIRIWGAATVMIDAIAIGSRRG